MAESNQLIPTEKYLTTGSHIGTTFKTGDMRRYIFKKRKDRLYVLDVENIDKRLRIASQFLAQYPFEKIVVVARRLYSQIPAKKFAELTGCKAITGRFVPGTFTNPNHKNFIEPKVLIVADPESDSQAVTEATKQRIPVVALASTHNYLKFIDLAIPINNKGRKSLALVFWVLTREMLKERGDIKKDSEFSTPLEAFEYQIQEGAREEGEEDPVRQAMKESQKLRYKGRKGTGNRSKPGGQRRGKPGTTPRKR
ncbi:30S ribosomal protein S2 [Candidatus Micrarchaeota archaeon]|nr:30S ribosomal protein S2 [Candidatus Micrarchaeota archaeon]MBU1930926.1 30S ribosomal protein S2 [Candidatus Micrarchaeota archaeon]